MTKGGCTVQVEPFESRSSVATAAGAHAFRRLLALAGQRDSGQIGRVMQFIDATYNGQGVALDLFDLRALDICIGERRARPIGDRSLMPAVAGAN